MHIFGDVAFCVVAGRNINWLGNFDSNSRSIKPGGTKSVFFYILFLFVLRRIEQQRVISWVFSKFCIFGYGREL